jgi:hypothetical protein
MIPMSTLDNCQNPRFVREGMPERSRAVKRGNVRGPGAVAPYSVTMVAMPAETLEALVRTGMAIGQQ